MMASSLTKRNKTKENEFCKERWEKLKEEGERAREKPMAPEDVDYFLYHLEHSVNVDNHSDNNMNKRGGIAEYEAQQLKKQESPEQPAYIFFPLFLIRVCLIVET